MISQSQLPAWTPQGRHPELLQTETLIDSHSNTMSLLLPLPLKLLLLLLLLVLLLPPPSFFFFFLKLGLLVVAALLLHACFSYAFNDSTDTRSHRERPGRRALKSVSEAEHSNRAD